MLRDVSKSTAMLNAQSIMCAAVLFGHGDFVSLKCNSTAVVLTLVYDNDYAIYEREIKWLSDRFMCGCTTWKVEDSESFNFAIFVSWVYNPDLK